ncbi:unnamed protein product [Lota lota]
MGLDRTDGLCCWGFLMSALGRGWNLNCTSLWQHHNISREAIREQRLPPQSVSQASRMLGQWVVICTPTFPAGRLCRIPKFPPKKCHVSTTARLYGDIRHCF